MYLVLAANQAKVSLETFAACSSESSSSNIVPVQIVPARNVRSLLAGLEWRLVHT